VSKIGFIVQKEVRHILRDPKSLAIVVLMPLLQTLLYGYAVNLDTRNIRLAVVDRDLSEASRELADSFLHSGYFIPASAPARIGDFEEALRSGKAHAVLVMREGLSEALQSGKPYQLGLMVDGSDANRAAAVTNYSNVVVYDFVRSNPAAGASALQQARGGVRLSLQILYNPDLRSAVFFVPGIVAVILMMISALLTSITIVREKETGTMEQLMTAPVGPRQIIAGKVIPYIAVAFFDGVLVLAFGALAFDVPFRGSYLLLAFLGVVYVVAALSIGVLISTITSTQLVAMLTALLVTVLPSIMLSGFIFEIKNMPLPLRYLSAVIPARHFLEMIRGIMLKGVGLPELWHQLGALVAMTLVLFALAVKSFKVRLG